ncbi:LysE family translocator [Novispirillum itersonii]|uniref:Threonine/homoserine/homoserine lactone efflux protein n=1 Tax=Novispirillum itersonii TaxID=189 RepID=A0A7X0DKB7_NOVIT|nr:LysE family translocator [Novispirillum itersonii]MBB6208801.1 threonine/homoserine/homoserine lactone efflux protein [Novispirillum itersonii]
MLPVIASMLTFALVGSITPGPVNIIATASGARFGLRRTLPHVTGATVGYVLVVAVTGLTLAEATRLLPQVSRIMALGGALFLLWMAFRIATAPVTAADAADTQATPPRLTDGALVQILNPKAWLWAMSGVGLFVSGPDRAAGAMLALFCLLSFAMCFVGVGSWAVLGHLIRQALAAPERQRWFNRAMGALLAASVLPLLPEVLTAISGDL